jgi:hypothetical protein
VTAVGSGADVFSALVADVDTVGAFDGVDSAAAILLLVGVSAARFCCKASKKDWPSAPLFCTERSAVLLATELLVPKDCSMEVAWDISNISGSLISGFQRDAIPGN